MWGDAPRRYGSTSTTSAWSAAAYAAGVFSLADACRAVGTLSRLMGALPGGRAAIGRVCRAAGDPVPSGGRADVA